MLWLEENDDLSMEYMYGAIEKDKKDGVSLSLLNMRSDNRFTWSGFIYLFFMFIKP